MDITLSFLLIIFGILFFSSLIHGTIGFGFPMISTPLLALFTDMQTAIMLTLMPTVLVNSISIISEEKFITAFKHFFPMAFITMIGSAIGTFILVYAHSDVFKLLLAAMIVMYLMMDKLNIKFTFIKKIPKVSLAIAGLLGGLTNVMAPILIIYALESNYTKSQTIQFSNVCFLLGKIVQLAIFGLLGSFSIQAVSASLSSLLAVGLALYLGVAIKKRINAKIYVVFIKLLLLVISLLLLYQVLGK